MEKEKRKKNMGFPLWKEWQDLTLTLACNECCTVMCAHTLHTAHWVKE